jgi:branched-chain amino acid transport system permease protein
MVFLLTSLGIYIVLQNMISMTCGDQTRMVRTTVVEGVDVFGARVTPVQALIMATSVTLIITVWILSKRTRLGLIMRAVAADPELARTLGINNDKVMLCAFGLASGLAGVAGVLVALDVDMTPSMGLNALLLGAVATIVGGVGSIPGVAFGALLIGMAQHLGVWWIGSQWQDAIAFVILLAFLLVRPEGVLGKRLRKAAA